MGFLARVAFSALALWVTSLLIPGRFHVLNNGSWLGLIVSLLIVALVLTLVNSIIRPFVKLLSLPLYLLTFGLFSLAVNGMMLWLTSRLATGYFLGSNVGLNITGGFWSYIWAAIVLSIVQTVIGWFTRNKRPVQVERAPERGYIER